MRPPNQTTTGLNHVVSSVAVQLSTKSAVTTWTTSAAAAQSNLSAPVNNAINSSNISKITTTTQSIFVTSQKSVPTFSGTNLAFSNSTSGSTLMASISSGTVRNHGTVTSSRGPHFINSTDFILTVIVMTVGILSIIVILASLIVYRKLRKRRVSSSDI